MMKKTTMAMLALMLTMLTACEKSFMDDVENRGNGQVANALLQVRTRGGSGDEATISYPVQVFVLQGDECRAMQTIADEEQTLNIALVEGTYSVYAVGGASEDDYIVPSEEDATTTTAIALREGHSHGDLMAASAMVTLVDGGTNTVTLGMIRKTMLIQAIEIKKVPTAATAVSVTIAPLWRNLTVSGTYSGTAGSQTIALTKQEDNRTWTLPSPFGEGSGVRLHLLPPSSQPASVSVNITIGGATKTYTYSTSDQLEAGYKINIDGTYTEAVGVTLTGTITGAEWLGERTISFEFDENGSSTSEPENPQTPANAFPTAGDTYEGCYVLASIVAADGESAELTLLSPNEKYYANVSGVTLDYLQTKAADHGTDGISSWRTMTSSEVELLQAAHATLGIDGTRNYLFGDGDTVKQMLMSNGSVSTPSSGAAYFRPVAVVTVTDE